MEPDTKKTKTESKKIVLLGGDFCGPEVIAEAVKVLNSVAEATGTKFEFEDRLIGGAAIEKEGEPITDETLEICRKADSMISACSCGLFSRAKPSTDDSSSSSGNRETKP